MHRLLAIVMVILAVLTATAAPAQQQPDPDADGTQPLVDKESRDRHRRNDPFLQYAQNVDVRINQLETWDFPVMRAFISVTDESDIQIRSLLPEDFTVDENGVDAGAVRFADRDELNLPLSIMLVLDVSGSMDVIVEEETETTALDMAKQAIGDFVSQLSPRDRVGLITFSDAALNEVRMTTNHNELLNRMDQLTAWGQTSLWDGVYLAMEDLISDTQPARRAIIVLSDGMDNRSLENPLTVLQWYEDEALANNIGFSVYTLGLGTEIDRNALGNVASRTGGLYFDSPTPADLAGLYQDILQQINNEYLIEWDSPGPTSPGQIIDVTVGITPVQSFDPGRITYRSPGLSAALARALWPGVITVIVLVAILIITTIFKLSRRAWLTVMITPLEGKDYSVTEAGLDIGTMENCELRRPGDPAMLPIHASVRESVDGFVLEVLDPDSPIIMGNQLLARKLLRNGDRFTLGTTAFVFNERVVRPGEGEAVLAEHIVDMHPREQLTEAAQVAAQSGQAPPAPIGRVPQALVAVSGPHAGQRFDLAPGETVIGRQGCTISLPQDTQVSRRHCVINITGDSATLTDPGSTNGTRLNHAHCQPGMAQAVRSGDTLSIGSGEYKLE